MALSQTDLDALDRAIATAELEVEIDGHKVKYRSIAELTRARAHVAQVISQGAAAAGGVNRAVYRPNFVSFRD